MIKRLITVANKLDTKGQFVLADAIDDVLYILAKSEEYEWQHKDAEEYMEKLTKEFGEPHIAPGEAIWHDIAGFSVVFIKDESVPHDFPKPHRDFVYARRHISVDPDLVGDFANVTGSIIIDGLKNEVTARCGNLFANAITLGFVEDVVNDAAKATPNEYARRINKGELPPWYKNQLRE